MVLDDHEVTLAKLRVHAAAGIAGDENLAAQCFHDAHGKCELLERIAFVGMDASFHGHDSLAGQLAADKVSRVRGDCRTEEMGDILERNRRLGRDVLGQAAESSSENDSDPWRVCPTLLDNLPGFLNLIE